MTGIETAFIANVGTEPELKTSQAGKPWTAFSACVGEGEEVQWLRLVVFGERAQQIAGSVKKGDRIYAEGRLKLESWSDKNGQSRTGIKVAAWRIERLGEIGRNKPSKPKALPEGTNPAPPSTRNWQRPADDIPFAPEWR